MDFSKFEDRFTRIDLEIQRLLEDKEPKKLYNASNHLTKAGGKRMRPLLCLLSCESVGGDFKSALPTAVSIELIHTFTLIHDDIMDRDELRRGFPAVHTVYGESTAILAGDLLFSKAFEICNPEIAPLLGKTTSEICEGQELDMEFADRDVVSEEEYMEMIQKKTASLFAAATRSGAILGNGTKDQVNALADYGINLGLAFQIWDDILDITADEDKLGKPVGSDIIEGKKTLLIVVAISKSPKSENLIEILNKKEKSKQEVGRAIELLYECGAVDYCEDKVKQLIKNAHLALKKIPDSKSRDDLGDIANFVVQREF